MNSPYSHPRPYKPLEVIIIKFWEQVNKTDYCWIWLGGSHSIGYGCYWIPKTKEWYRSSYSILAHHFSWELLYGRIPSNKLLCHHCDNPKCVNPAHLFIGDHASNAKDMVNKNRQCRGEDKPSSKLKEADVREIRRLRAHGLTIQELANRYNVSTPTIIHIIQRVKWKHI